MSDFSVALARIRSLERAVRAPFTGNPAAFLDVLSGHLGGGPADAGTVRQAPGRGFEPADLLLLDGVLRARFVPAASAGSGRLLRPLDGAVSSPFGERDDPLTGGSRHHAPRGLRAAGGPLRA